VSGFGGGAAESIHFLLLRQHEPLHYRKFSTAVFKHILFGVTSDELIIPLSFKRKRRGRVREIAPFCQCLYDSMHQIRN